MSTLADAVEVLQNRKHSAVPEESWVDDEGARIDEATIKRMAVGLDIDFDQAREIAGEVSASAVRTLKRVIEEGYPSIRGFREISGSLWFDGLLTGLLLAELRAKEALTNSPS